MKITQTDQDLILTIPLTQTRHSPYEDVEWEDDNIIAVIEPDECGFCYRIDMSYKGKPDQHTDFFFKYFGDEKEFIKICEDLKIEIIKYDACIKCGEILYGCYTWHPKGGICQTCSWKEEEGDVLDNKEFYDLMQIYRHIPITEQEKTTEAFEEVKKYIKRKRNLL